MEKTSFYDHIAKNKRNSVLLVLFFLVFIAILGYVLGLIFGSPYFGIGIGVFVALIMILITFSKGDSIILKTSGAVPADKKSHAHLMRLIIRLIPGRVFDQIILRL